MTLGGSSGSWAAAASATRSNVQYNPAGDTRQRVRTSSLEIGFLGNSKDDSFNHITMKIVCCFEEYLVIIKNLFGKIAKVIMFPPGLEPGTFRVLGERDNHYTTETCI